MENQAKVYAIVKFIDEDDALGVVCTSWITNSGSECFYPNVRSDERRDRMLKMQSSPEPGWVSSRIKIMQKYSKCNNNFL
jgi:hypothetical protein